MSEIIDKPIEVASEVLDRAEINGGTVLVQYGKTEAALATLRTRYEGVLFDLTTTAGDKAARAGRLELVTLRTSLEKKRKAAERLAQIEATTGRKPGKKERKEVSEDVKLSLLPMAFTKRGSSPDVLEQDHVVAISKGGAHTASNVVPACKPCNSSKRDLSVEEFFARRVACG